MKKGNLLGKGMTAEVYEWGSDKVLKLYFDRISEEWINDEVNIAKIVKETGVPSPAIYDRIEVDGRRGIIFQRIFGKSILSYIQAEPWKLYHYALQLANLQYRIHRYSAKNLPNQKERFKARIQSSSIILENKVNEIFNFIDSLPDGSSVCHGDFHFNNIIVSRSGLVPIDWTNAYQGNPLGDVARTCLMINSPSSPPMTPSIIIATLQYTKWLTYQTYLNEYIRLANVSFEDIDSWILPAAAAKLKDKVPGEEKWLMDMINKRIDNLKIHP